LKTTLVILSIFVLLLSGNYFWIYLKERDIKTLNYHLQIGDYLLDIQRTELGTYMDDSNKYKNLKMSFYSNHTFLMNFKVPFIFDSVGRWNAAGAGLEDWNWLYYESWGYSSYKENIGDQFTSPWTPDSIFYINGATPQRGKEGIQRIYFKKIGLK